jgi:hypothetical protein
LCRHVTVSHKGSIEPDFTAANNLWCAFRYQLLSIVCFTVTLTGCSKGGDDNAVDLPSVVLPPKVEVSVQASDAHGNPLSYEWRSTDGVINDINAATTTWQLPAGPGLHFAYVNVSNGKGGYTERRIAVSTDDIGLAAKPGTPVDFFAPAAAPAAGNFYQGVLRRTSYCNDPNAINDPNAKNNSCVAVYIPDAVTYLFNQATNAVTDTVTSNLRGYFTIPEVVPGGYTEFCASDNTQPFEDCTNSIDDITVFIGTAPALDEANSNYYHSTAFSDRNDYMGRVVLQDGSPCGQLNEFFDKGITAKVSVLASDGTVLDGPRRANAWGHYGLSSQINADSVKIECESASASVPVTTYSSFDPRTSITNSSTPIVTTMTASLDGSLLPDTAAIFLPPPTGGLPSDNFPGTDIFLTFKGIDSRKSACQYYLKIGAVKSCGADGTLGSPVTFDDWKSKVRMDPYADAGHEDIVATYVNAVDLNLTRNHHSNSYGADQTAAYVCNHLGPSDDTQETLDTVIDNAINGRNLVACVAMDHLVHPGVNGDQAFTRFMIFGPSGELLPSVNLDGRGEKFAPGVCVACHGGDKYAGRFPEDGSGHANIGAHFLPYDVANFRYSSKPGLTRAEQEEAIYELNQNVKLAGPTVATTELIDGWYAAGNKILDEDYLPASWQGKPAAQIDYYKKVYAKSCRTCHVAFTEELNFDHYSNLNLVSPHSGLDGLERIGVSSCEGGSASFVREYSMPNSLTTMNLYWNSAGTATDQPAITAAFFNSILGVNSVCDLTNLPPP